jgi:hypothetical protein
MSARLPPYDTMRYACDSSCTATKARPWAQVADELRIAHERVRQSEKCAHAGPVCTPVTRPHSSIGSTAHTQGKGVPEMLEEIHRGGRQKN